MRLPVVVVDVTLIWIRGIVIVLRVATRILDNLCEVGLAFGTDDSMLVSIPLILALMAIHQLPLLGSLTLFHGDPNVCAGQLKELMKERLLHRMK